MLVIVTAAEVRIKIQSENLGSALILLVNRISLDYYLITSFKIKHKSMAYQSLYLHRNQWWRKSRDSLFLYNPMVASLKIDCFICCFLNYHIIN